jgi:hypothetical protein
MSVFIKANVKFHFGLIMTYMKPYRRLYEFFPRGTPALCTPGSLRYRRLTITIRHTTLGGTHLKTWLVRRRDLYLTTHNSQKRKTFMPPVGIELAISAIEWPQTDRAITGMTVGIPQRFPNYRTNCVWNVGFTRRPLYSRRESCLSSLD